jgi:hypothetical protein
VGMCGACRSQASESDVARQTWAAKHAQGQLAHHGHGAKFGLGVSVAGHSPALLVEHCTAWVQAVAGLRAPGGGH